MIGIDVCIFHRKYQVNPRSCPWFSTTCAAAIAHIDHFFPFFEQDKNLLCLRPSSGRRVIVTKEFLKLSDMFMLIKQKSLSPPRKLAPAPFYKLLIAFFTKVNLLFLLYFMVLRCCSLHLIKQSCLLKSFLTVLILMTLVFFYLLSFQG